MSMAFMSTRLPGNRAAMNPETGDHLVRRPGLGTRSSRSRQCRSRTRAVAAVESVGFQRMLAVPILQTTSAPYVVYAGLRDEWIFRFRGGCLSS